METMTRQAKPGNEIKPTVKITVELDARVAELLSVLDTKGDVKAVLILLADHVQQGVYRPGAWERHWLEQVFGNAWQSKLVPGDPYGRPHCEGIFQKVGGGS